jgi:hypothetical protein
MTWQQPLWEGPVDESLRPSQRERASFLDQKRREVADEVVFVLGADHQRRAHAVENLRAVSERADKKLPGV